MEPFGDLREKLKASGLFATRQDEAICFEIRRTATKPPLQLPMQNSKYLGIPHRCSKLRLRQLCHVRPTVR